MKGLRYCTLLLATAGSALPALAAAPLPRVFFAPAERAAITAMRRAGPESAATVAVTAAGGQAASGTAPLSAAKLDGISLARTGGRFAWIDGRRYPDGAAFGRWRLRVARYGVDLLRGGRVERRLRVGEALAGRDAGTNAAP